MPRQAYRMTPDRPSPRLCPFGVVGQFDVVLQERSAYRDPVESSGAGYLVRIARERAGLSQVQLADRARTSQPTIARAETGRRVPSVRSLVRMVSATGLDLVVGLRERNEIVVLGTLSLVGRHARFQALHDDGVTL
jgi:DNA-binding XRE family transcriptional regulator